MHISPQTLLRSKLASFLVACVASTSAVAGTTVSFDLGLSPAPNSPAPVNVVFGPGDALPIYSGAILRFASTGALTEQYCLIGTPDNTGCAHLPAITTNPNGLSNPVDPSTFVLATSPNVGHAPIGAVFGIFTQFPIGPSSVVTVTIDAPDKTSSVFHPSLNSGFFIGSGETTGGSQQYIIAPLDSAYLLVGSWVVGDVLATDAGSY